MKTYALCTLEMGIPMIDALRRHVPLAGMIGLTEREASDRISGYRWMLPYCQRQGLDFLDVRSYSLSKPEDKERLLKLDIDYLVVAGWQRLVPLWLINHCQCGVIGVHGSTRGIARGRGRSPQNWALLLGGRSFSVSIFEIDAGVDSGDVLKSRRFALESWDDIKTSHYKVGWLAGHMIGKYIADGSGIASIPQTAQLEYLPQRLPEDGEIDWRQSSEGVYNFVRALTRPYPGAFSIIDGKRVTIWRGRPLDLGECDAFSPGEIVAKYPCGDFLVRTATGLFLVEDYDAGEELSAGDILPSANFSQQIAGIVKRHSIRYPALLPISTDVRRRDVRC